MSDSAAGDRCCDAVERAAAFALGFGGPMIALEQFAHHLSISLAPMLTDR